LGLGYGGLFESTLAFVDTENLSSAFGQATHRDQRILGSQSSVLFLDGAHREKAGDFFLVGLAWLQILQQNIINKLEALDGSNPKLPVGPIAADQKGEIADMIQRLIAKQEAQLIEAIRSGAQAKVNQLKVQLANQVANTLAHQLNRSFSFYDNWTDPVIGLRGRFNLNKTFYLTAQTDVGGFGVGSDIAWRLMPL
jgi:hypothetical protein